MFVGPFKYSICDIPRMVTNCNKTDSEPILVITSVVPQTQTLVVWRFFEVNCDRLDISRTWTSVRPKN